jgi:hypothetical protein
MALLVRQQAELAVEYAQSAEKALTVSSPLARQLRVLELNRQALERAGKGNLARPLAERIDKLEADADKAYRASTPSFKPANFAGRKGDSKRVAVVELFTGAQCPPCLAADVAFEVLVKTYRPTDVVMMQYHVHIPGPDPMTNEDTEARWQYYRSAYADKPKQVGGVPSALICGSTLRVGGGTVRTVANGIYNTYRSLVEPILETPAACQVKATAKRVGDKIQIQAEVVGLANPGQDKRLRLVLVEETIRYQGGNGIRFHDHVVRAMPGGAAGKAVTVKAMKTDATVDVVELRESLNTYLDNFVIAKGFFPRPDRPLDMRNLKVIAFVQDDATTEILQAVQTDVVQ